MLFSSLTFIFVFLPFVFLSHWIIQKKYRNVFLAITSLIFYFWGEQRLYILPFSILVNYIVAKYISEIESKLQRKYLLLLGIVFNIGLLGYYKYVNFFTTNLIKLGFDLTLTNIVLPIGISFFVFQQISLLVDVYRAKESNEPYTIKFLNIVLFVSLFPQLIAGPIVKYHQIINQIEERVFNSNQIQLGIERFIKGLAKKVILADTMGSVVNDAFSRGIASWSGTEAFVIMLCYSLQIYFDFSGYSDMAIGLAKMFGFEFQENFNFPYISKSITEFWQRWNISLGVWFREYIYIPLGGNRVSKLKILRNLGIVFLLTGIWHGAAWTFVIWGIWHGFWVILERLGLKFWLEKLPSIFGLLYSWIIVYIGWIFFRASSLSEARLILSKLSEIFTTNNHYLNLNKDSIIILVLAVILAFPLVKLLDFTGLRSNKYLKFAYQLGLLGIFGLSIMFIAGKTQNSFIYFQF